MKQPRLAEEFVEIGEQTEPTQGEMRDRREQLGSQHVRSSQRDKNVREEIDHSYSSR